MFGIKEAMELTKTTDLRRCDVYGILVSVGGVLSLIDIDYGDNYRTAPRLIISRPDINFALLHQLLLDGGGESAYFHKAKVNGIVTFDGDRNTFLIEPLAMTDEENIKADTWVVIDLSEQAIDKGRKEWSGKFFYV